jgi:hypothetical protein
MSPACAGSSGCRRLSWLAPVVPAIAGSFGLRRLFPACAGGCWLAPTGEGPTRATRALPSSLCSSARPLRALPPAPGLSARTFVSGCRRMFPACAGCSGYRRELRLAPVVPASAGGCRLAPTSCSLGLASDCCAGVLAGADRGVMDRQADGKQTRIRCPSDSERTLCVHARGGISSVGAEVARPVPAHGRGLGRGLQDSRRTRDSAPAE